MSELLRASNRVSSGFALHKHSSPSFRSQQMCSYSKLSKSTIGQSMMRSPFRGDLTSAASSLYFHCACGFYHSKTRTHVRLLGPCFKTGRMKSHDCQQPWHSMCTVPLKAHCVQSIMVENKLGRERPAQKSMYHDSSVESKFAHHKL